MGEGATGIQAFITAVTAPIKAQLTLENLGIVIAAALGISIVFVLGWTAYRFIYNKVKGGFKKGK